MRISSGNSINRKEWSRLVQANTTGTWFQTPEAYDFFNAQKDVFKPFVVAVANIPSSSEAQHSINPLLHEQVLRAICVGYITKERSNVKQFFTRRAIIPGGPCLADDATDEEVNELMKAVRQQLQSQAIYIETRNFNDYSRWKKAFETAGFSYQPHLNFHVHTNQPWENIEENIGKHRRKYIRLSFRDGATIEDNPTIEQVRSYYVLLQELYRTKVKMPLPSWSFFEQLYHLDSCKYLLVMYEGQVVGGSTCVLLKKSPITDDQSPLTSAGGVYEWYACGKDGVYKNIHPSSVTKYAGMKYACDNGYAVFDMMGAGKPNAEYGVRDFKAEFGGKLVENGRYLCITKPILYKIGVLGVLIIKKFN